MASTAESEAGVLARQHRRPMRLSAHRDRLGIAFTVPVLVIELALLFVPVAETFYYSFTNWNGQTAQWVGLGTYVSLFKDPAFWRVLANNGLLLLSVPMAIGIPLGVAFLLHTRIWGWKFFRSVYFLPTAISWVVIGMVAVQFFSGQGILNHMLAPFGIQQNMLSGEVPAMVAVMITLIWSLFGQNTIIFVTGMATLDPALYAAARVDGASQWHVFWRVTVPLLRRFEIFAFVTTLISAFSGLFSLIFVMTGGGPGYGTTTLEFFVYQQAFEVGLFGFGATLGVVLFVIMFAISILQIRVLQRED